MVGSGWRTYLVDPQGTRRPNPGAAYERTRGEWRVLEPDADFHLGAETKDQGGRHDFFFGFPRPEDIFTLRIEGSALSIADGVSSPITLHYRGASDPTTAEIPISDGDIREAEEALFKSGVPTPELGSRAADMGEPVPAPVAPIQETVAIVRPVASANAGVIAPLVNEAGAAQVENLPHEADAKGRQALENLYTYAQQHDLSEFNATLQGLIEAGRGELIVENLPMLILSKANATHIANQFIAHGQERLVLTNFHRFVEYGAEPDYLLTHMGSEARNYLSDFEVATSFARTNLAALQRSQSLREMFHNLSGFRIALHGAPGLTEDRPMIVGRRGEIVIADVLDIDLSTYGAKSESGGTDDKELFRITPEAEQKWPVNDRTIEEAARRLDVALSHDPELSSVINRYISTLRIDQRTDVVRALRTNQSLRSKVGSHLLTRAEELASSILAPQRIRANTDKEIEAGGYAVRQATSREYASMLALAMLDGSFDARRVGVTDVASLNPDGTIKNGNHRIGAEMILGIWRPTR